MDRDSAIKVFDSHPLAADIVGGGAQPDLLVPGRRDYDDLASVSIPKLERSYIGYSSQYESSQYEVRKE